MEKWLPLILTVLVQLAAVGVYLMREGSWRGWVNTKIRVLCRDVEVLKGHQEKHEEKLSDLRTSCAERHGGR